MTSSKAKVEGVTELIERVRNATGPDRALDEAIRHSIDAKMVEPQLLWRETLPYTASIDASIALAERLLGHAVLIEVTTQIGAAQHSCVIDLVELDEPISVENVRTAPLAILLALLTALSLESDNAQ